MLPFQHKHTKDQKKLDGLFRHQKLLLPNAIGRHWKHFGVVFVEPDPKEPARHFDGIDVPVFVKIHFNLGTRARDFREPNAEGVYQKHFFFFSHSAQVLLGQSGAKSLPNLSRVPDEVNG